MTYGSGHYWASEDLNTTGENVGITLDSMCDIIMANDVTSGNTVVFIPGDIEHGQKGHFALGEGGGGSAEIDASIYQVIVGDGEGNGVGAQGGAEAQESNKIYLKNKRLGPNIPTCEDDGTPIQDVDTGSFTIASNGLGHTHTEIEYDETLDANVEVQVEDDGWKATIEDLAKVLVTGKSKIEIGEHGADYSANAKFWNEHPAGPEIKIKGAAHIEMLGKANELEDDQYAWGVPSVSMRGNCLIDMCDTIGNQYTGQAYQADVLNIRQAIFNETTSWGGDGKGIFAARNYAKQNAPLMQMKGRAIISARDEAVLKMTESACATFEGNAYFKVNGGGYTGSYNSLQETDKFQHAEFNAGTVFMLDGNGSSADNDYSVLAVMPKQLIFSNEGKNGAVTPSSITNPSSFSNSKHGDVLSSVGYLWNGSYYNPTYITYVAGVGHHNRYIDDTYNLRKIGFSGDYTAANYIKSNNIKLNQKQSVLIEGTTKIKMGSSSMYTSLDMSGEGNSVILHSQKARYNSSNVVQNEVGSNASSFMNVKLDDGATSVVQYSVKGGATSNIFMEAYGKTDISMNFASTAYSPSGVPSVGTPRFGMNFSPVKTDIEVKWNQLQMIWEGYKHFIQVDGETHFENWSGKFITRAHQPNVFKVQSGICWPEWRNSNKPQLTKNASTSIEIAIYEKNGAPTTTPTAQEVYDSNTYYFDTALAPESWSGKKYTYNTINGISLNGQGSGRNYYELKLKNYRIKEKNTITFKFDDATEYITFEDLQAAIEANPEKFLYTYPSNMYDRVIGLYSGTLLSHTAVDGIWQYTVSNSVTIRDWTEKWVKITDSSSRDDDYYYPVVNGGYNDQTYYQTKSLIQNFYSYYGNYVNDIYYLPSNGSSTALVYTDSVRYRDSSDYVYTDAIVSEARVRASYAVTGTAVYDPPVESADVDWFLPNTQQSQISAVNNTAWNKSPIVQLVGTANISIRDKFTTDTRYYTFTTSNTYDTTNQKQAIEDFIASGTDYDGLIDYISNIQFAVAGNINYPSECRFYTPELWNILEIEEVTAGSEYKIHFTIKPQGWNEHIESTADSPVVEITDDSEIRLYDGAIIKGYHPDFGETTFEFKSSDSSEEAVSFTLSELKALKQMLNNI